MKYIMYWCIRVSIVFSVLLFGSSCVHASTIVPRTDIFTDVVWTASSSPYIVQDSIIITRGATLTIGPGVEIKMASTSINIYDRPQIYVNGSLFLNGTSEAPIFVHDIYGISIDFGTTSINHSVIDVPGGLNVVSSRVDIISSTIKHANEAIHDVASEIHIINSYIQENGIGIFVIPPGGIFMVRGDGSNDDIGGIGNAFWDSPILLARNMEVPTINAGVTISSSTLIDNTQYAIKNNGIDPVHAIHNWWGSFSGPVNATSSAIDGPVEFDPWIKHETVCCSSILFIPGIEGSRLYSVIPARKNTSTSTRRLWEPNSNADVTKLYLNATGSSMDASIYSDSPIGLAYGIKGVYGSFMKFLDGLSSRNMFTEWKSFSYDWRKAVPDIVVGNEKRATTTESLIDLIVDMASSSKTGKVTIVAHSNGGLVAKYLVKILTEQGKENLIDSVLGVAVPYIGTPEAIPDLLHGYNQSILKGLVLKESTARNLAINMPSAYSLLPSAEYFAKVLGPSIAFASTTEPGINSGSYPKEISSILGQNSFIVDTNNARKNSVASDTSLPIKGNQSLLASAGLFHGILDSFRWPDLISTWSILGWNIPTTKTLYYSSNDRCTFSWTGMRCLPKLSYSASTTAMGDGAVVAPSAAYDTSSVVSLDLKQISRSEGTNISHANILESSTTQKQIEDIITHKYTADSAQFIRVQGVSYGEPDYTKEPTFIVVHSSGSVGLNVYDSIGHHTGETVSPPEVTDDVVTAYEEVIPGSRYITSHSDQNSSIYIPDSGGRYSIVAQGSGVGTFDLTVNRVQGGAILDSIHFDAIPVTPTTIASTTIETSYTDISTAPSLASSTANLVVDAFGDNSNTILVHPNTEPNLINYIDVFKKYVDKIDVSHKHSKDIIKRITRLQDIVRKGGRLHVQRGKEYERNWMHYIKYNKISSDERDSVIKYIDMFISQFE